jgi:AraC-like DNA-binding protein
MIQKPCTILQGPPEVADSGDGGGHDSRWNPMTSTTRSYRELATIIARFATREGEVPTAISGLFLSRRTSLTQPLHTTQSPCFALVAQGARSLTIAEQIFEYGVGDYLVVALDIPVISRTMRASVDAPLLGFGLTLNSQTLRELVARIDITPPEPRGGARCVAVHTASPDVLDATLRLLRLLDRPEDIPAMAPLIEQELLYRLLTGPFGPRLLQLAMTESQSCRIAKAIAWLRVNFAQPLRVDELAERVGMSVSSLHHHFKASTAVTPMQYQKQLRLHEARRLMLLEDFDAGTAGYQVGYQSPSQFSREYRRLYGLSPRRDVERLKGSPASKQE